jgi:hypothetical protein
LVVLVCDVLDEVMVEFESPGAAVVVLTRRLAVVKGTRVTDVLEVDG